MAVIRYKTEESGSLAALSGQVQIYLTGQFVLALESLVGALHVYILPYFRRSKMITVLDSLLQCIRQKILYEFTCRHFLVYSIEIYFFIFYFIFIFCVSIIGYHNVHTFWTNFLYEFYSNTCRHFL